MLPIPWGWKAIPGTAPSSASVPEARRLRKPCSPQFTAAAAVWGVSVSTLASMLFLMARHAFVGLDPRIRAADATEGQSYSALIRELIHTAIPVCLGSLAVSMGSLVDLFTVMNRLGDAVAANPGYFAAEYAAISWQTDRPWNSCRTTSMAPIPAWR